MKNNTNLKIYGLTLVSVVALGVGCTTTITTDTNTANPNINTSTTNTNTVSNVANSNAITPPVTNQKTVTTLNVGPYTHEVRSASSSDGLTWTHDSSEPLVEHASVPVAITQPNGNVMVYYVDASNRPEALGCIRSTDNGASFTKANCVVNGSAVTRMVDFTVVQLENDQYRLYYFGSNGVSGDPAANEGDHKIYTAVSDDGISFTETGEVFAYPGLVDPDVFWNGSSWVMHVFSITESKTVVATSSDGTNFAKTNFLEPSGYGVNKPVTLTDGTFRMYGFKQGQQDSIYSFTSADGLTWLQESGTRLAAPTGYEITDPSVVQLHDDTYKMFYKVSQKINPKN